MVKNTVSYYYKMLPNILKEGSSHFIFRINTATVNCFQKCGFYLNQTNEGEYAKEIKTIKERIY